MGTANVKKHLMRCCPKEWKAADEKIRAWNRYKRCPTARNLSLQRNACKRMEDVHKWVCRGGKKISEEN